MSAVLCKCGAVTVKANFCRACGKSIATAPDVTLCEHLRLGIGFYWYEDIKEHVSTKGPCTCKEPETNYKFGEEPDWRGKANEK